MRIPTRRSEKDNITKFDPHMTQDKFDELKSKLDRLKNVTRFKWMQEVAELASGGDFSENAGYQAAKGKLRGINATIAELESHLKKAVIITPSKGNVVALGSVVTVKIGEQVKTYTILGSSEVDIAKNIISHNSPIGSALMGRSRSEHFNAAIGGRTVACEILEIN